MVKAKAYRCTGIFRIEVLFVDKGDLVFAIVNARDETRKEFIADHALLIDAFGRVGKLQNGNGLPSERGGTDRDRLDSCQATLRHLVAGAASGLAALRFHTQLLRGFRRQDVVATGVDNKGQRFAAIDRCLDIDVVVDQLKRHRGFADIAG